MPRFLALDWDNQQLHVVAAALARGRMHLERAAAWKEEQSPNPAEAEALGRHLRERLKSAGIAPAPVLVCVGRDRVILKEIRYPSVPAHEEPAVVQFQVSKELTEGLDEVVIDYVRTGTVGATGEQRALALVIRRELLATYETLCRAAGLKLAAVTPRPFGLLACWKHVVGTAAPAPEPADAAVALLTVEERGAEFSIAHNGKLLLARSLAAGPTLASEVRRNFAVHAAHAAQHPIGAIYVAGGEEHAPFRARLQDSLGIPVHAMDPFAGTQRPEVPATERGGFASAVGLLYARADQAELPINFARPKKPKPPRDINRTRLLAAGCVAAAFLLLGVFYCYGLLADKRQQYDTVNARKRTLESQLALMEEDDKRIALVEDWVQSGVVWLDELYDLTSRFPDPETIRLTSLTGDPVTRTTPTKPAAPSAGDAANQEPPTKYVAKLALQGVTTSDNRAIRELTDRFVEDNHYRVDAAPADQNTGTDKARFPQHFTAHVEVEKQAPEKYLRQLPLSTDEGDNGRRNNNRRSGGKSKGRGGHESARSLARHRDPERGGAGRCRLPLPQHGLGAASGAGRQHCHAPERRGTEGEARGRSIQAAKLRMERWKQLSLPSDVTASRREYDFYLSELLRESGFVQFSASPKQPEKSPEVLRGKGPAYTRLPYRIVGHATLSQLVTMLERFYQTGFLHQVRHLNVQRPTGNSVQQQQQQNLLEIRMDVEALIVVGVESRPVLLPAVSRRLLAIDVLAALEKAPMGLGLVLWAAGPTGPAGPKLLARLPGQYAAIAKKNIFLGTPTPDRTAEILAPPRFIRLTDITDNNQKCEAFLYDRLNNITTRLRAETGFDTFQVVGQDGSVLVRGKIIRLEGRDVYFQDSEDYFRMHVGEDLETVLNNPLTGEQLKGLGLSTVVKRQPRGIDVGP